MGVCGPNEVALTGAEVTTKVESRKSTNTPIAFQPNILCLEEPGEGMAYTSVF